MPDVKVSGLPGDTDLDGNHYTILNDPAGPTTKRTLLSTLAAWLFNQINIPAGSGSPVTRMSETLQDFTIVNTGLVTADALNSTRNGSMTAGVHYINGRRLTTSAVTARAYTASKDTYVDVRDNLDGTASLVYTEVAPGASSPSLAANSIRIAKVVTGASAITSVIAGPNTGQPAWADTNGNVIYNTSPTVAVYEIPYNTGGSYSLPNTTPGSAIPNLTIKLPKAGRYRIRGYIRNTVSGAGTVYGVLYLYNTTLSTALANTRVLSAITTNGVTMYDKTPISGEIWVNGATTLDLWGFKSAGATVNIEGDTNGESKLIVEKIG